MDIQEIQRNASAAVRAIEFVAEDAEQLDTASGPDDINEAYLDQAIRSLRAIKEARRVGS